MSLERIGLSWPLSGHTGWGIFGINLAINLARRGNPRPLLLAAPAMNELTVDQAAIIGPLADEQKSIVGQINTQSAGRTATMKDVLVLHALGNGFIWSELSGAIQGGVNVGFIFFEETRLDTPSLERARKFERILVGSTFNEEVLRRHGLDHVAKVLQGIDPVLFFPRPRVKAYGERFVVFSGGKLEPRKGQDLVLAAFRRFHETHPEALLITAWQNTWPELAKKIAASPHVDGAPEVRRTSLAIADWAKANGVDEDAFIDLGWVGHGQLPEILCEAHVALFPNRCEGGTNLAAMEAMACGVPCILSANSGHLDLIAEDNCYPLNQQSAANLDMDFPEDWRDSSIDEIVAHLEDAYDNRAEAISRGEKGAQFMQGLTWEKQTDKLVEAVSDLM